jgi:hypothetical protein
VISENIKEEWEKKDAWTIPTLLRQKKMVDKEQSYKWLRFGDTA